MVSHEQATHLTQPDLHPTTVGEFAVQGDGLLELQTLMNGLASIHAQKAAEVRDQRATDVELMESRGFALAAPDFIDQVNDQTRTKIHSYIPLAHRINNHDDLKFMEGIGAVEETEHEGLQRLHSFLSNFISNEQNTDEPMQYLIDDAQNILDNLTFLGRPELERATETVGAAWKAYLDADPENQLCLLTKITGPNLRNERRKSDEYVRDAILDSFTDEELERYSGRIVTNLYELNKDPANTRVVMVDDWSISGSQVREAVKDISTDRRFQKYKNSLEINLLVANKMWVEFGMDAETSDKEECTVPVKTCYLAHDADGVVDEEALSIITGQHSSVDFYFEDKLSKMVDRNRQMRPTDVDGVVLPSLTNIIRDYRTTESQYIAGAGRVRRAHV